MRLSCVERGFAWNLQESLFVFQGCDSILIKITNVNAISTDNLP